MLLHSRLHDSWSPRPAQGLKPPPSQSSSSDSALVPPARVPRGCRAPSVPPSSLQLRYSSPPPSPACWPCSACPLPGAPCRASSSAIARVRAVMACAPSMVAPSGPQCGFPVSPSSCPILHAAPRGWPADRGARRSGCPLLPTLVRAGTPFGRWAGDLPRTRSSLPRLRRNALRVCGHFLRNRSLTLSLCSLTLPLSLLTARRPD
mmetsp:Transcript_21964/g.67878  ORF Transcript_21964/g.67878 Transcript_21964/m.67878 type:complete len:205 (-) Transcript_21964:1593-2207(-)